MPVNNMYSPLRALLESSVASGFIKPENLSLMHIIDLPGGNTDGGRAEEWGAAAIEALREWSLPVCRRVWVVASSGLGCWHATPGPFGVASRNP